MMKTGILFTLCLILSASVSQHSSAQDAKPAPQQPAPSSKDTNQSYSGMYAFLKEGEFIQLTVEDEGRVTGFISRFGDVNSQGPFVNQFFKSGKLDGNKLSFSTAPVRGIWFDFKGSIDRGEGKNAGDEAYFVLNGTLTENSTDASKNVTSKTQDVALKSFPQEPGAK